jgi:NADH-quinone oxidoreductase subunit E
MGTACHVRGAARLLDELHGELGLGPGQTSPDGMFSLQRVNCLGACALGPIVVMNNRYHRHMTPLKLQRLLLSVRKTDRDSADE